MASRPRLFPAALLLFLFFLIAPETGSSLRPCGVRMEESKGMCILKNSACKDFCIGRGYINGWCTEHFVNPAKEKKNRTANPCFCQNKCA